MKKRESTFLKLDWPFKGLGKGIKKVAVSTIDFFNNDELRELSESLDSSMTRMTVSLEKMKKSMEKYREYNKAILAHKVAGQNLENANNVFTSKTREFERIAIEARRSSYLQNKIWQNRQN